MSSSDTIDISTSSAATHAQYDKYENSGVDWLGEIPTHWETIRLNWAADYINGYMFSPDDRGNEGLPIIRIAQLTGEDEEFDRYDGDLDEKYKITEGDLLFSWSATLDAFVWSREPAWLNQHIFKVEPIPKVDRRYLGYCLKSIIPVLVRDSHGSTMQHIKRQALKDHSIALPPPAEQRAIAAYLDRETERIDVLIEKKERLIDLLEEKRTALISRVVTKGFDADVEMKASGVEPIGKVPSHWRVKRNKWLYREAEERSETGEEELLTVSHKTGITPRSEKEDVNMIEAESTEGYKICRPGDLVINTMWAWKGALGISAYHGVVSPSYNVYRLREEEQERVEPRFLDYLYRIPAYVTEIDRHSVGVWKSRLRLYPDSFFRMATPLPPRTEQERIVQELDKEMEKWHRLEGKIKEAIKRLKEYRIALISAAVTGQIDVREEVSEGVQL